jgi:N-methylhydantoinase A
MVPSTADMGVPDAPESGVEFRQGRSGISRCGGNDSNMRIGIDVGGTFTDIVSMGDDGTVTIKKVPSTADNYSRAIGDALPALFAERETNGHEVREVLHATTVATNAILQLSGARTALITTKGFRDVLELRRMRMPELYNWNWDKPPDLVERRLRFEITERIDARGAVIVAPEAAEIAALIGRLVNEQVESIAICLLNSYINSAHEEMIADALAQRLPEVAVSVSSHILREVKEYERTATVVVNAYVLPLVRHYIRSLDTSLKAIDVAAPLMIMQSNGGMMTAGACATRPAYMIESGPAAGVIAAHAVSRAEHVPNLVAFDMGGTTAKASIIENGQISSASEYEVGSSLSAISRLIKGGGHLIRVPAIDIAEVGAGGGSVVWLDAGGALQIGPKSAGASPGPVCYSQGGTQVTTTDANLVLGYINPSVLAGGRLPVNRALAEAALNEQVAQPLNMSILQAAHGIHLLANSNMMRAVRSVSTERGRDVRDFALLAFGGNGPIHGCELARSLGMGEVIIPQNPGLFSAMGLLSARVEHHTVATFFHQTHLINLQDLNRAYLKLETEVVGLLQREGFAAKDIEISRLADVRYAGQASELTVPMRHGPLNAEAMRELETAFVAEHTRTYGHHGGTGEAYALTNLRVIGAISRSGGPITPREPNGRPAQRGSRRAYFGPEFGAADVAVVGRYDLSDAPTDGPLLIDEYDSTTVVPPHCTARLDKLANIRISIRGTP